MLIVFLIMLPVLALVALEIKNLLSAVIVLSAFSLVLSLVFYYLHAPDVAIAEAAIGSGFATVIFLIAIKKRGVLIMLTYPHSRFFYYDDKGRPTGFDYDILSLFARKLSIELEVRQVQDWRKLIPQLISGNGDVIGAGMTRLDERMKRICFSDGYFPTKVVIVTNIKNTALNSLSDLKGKIVTSVKDTSYLSALQSIKGVKIDTNFSDPNTLLQAVSEGRINAVAVDLPEALIGHIFYPNLKNVDTITGIQQYGYGVSKDKPELLAELNSFLKEINEDGTYQEVYIKYFH
ncbi:MAG: transporter substrate-binding domain-containing protein [Atribacterota bacterium]